MNERQLSKVVWAVKAVLIAALLYIAVDAILTPAQLGSGLTPQAVTGNERPQSETAADAVPQTPLDESVILDKNVFGLSQPPMASEAPRSPEPREIILPSAEELGLVLRGVVAAGPVRSRAIIEDTQANTTLPYKIGERVASATIESIEPERVVLRHQGQKAVLHIRSGASQGSPGATARPQRLETMTPEPVTSDAQAASPSAQLGYVENLFRKATIKPHVKGGRTEGLEISGLEETPLTKLFGLRNGDIVQTVNGQDLTSKQKAFEVLKKARSQSKIDLRLLRDGKTKDLSFDL